jgi:hypothetical protein
MDVKEAIAKAKSYIGELYTGEPIRDLGLEEVDRDGSDWLITLGFVRGKHPYLSQFSEALAEIANRRVYKVLHVDGQSGDVTSMKNRD